LAVGGAVGDQGQHLQLTLAEDLGWRLVVHRDLVAGLLVQVFHLDDRHVGLPPRS